MASGSYRQVDVGCPFYKFDDGQRKITCEGIVEGSSVVLTYLRKEDYVKQNRYQAGKGGRGNTSQQSACGLGKSLTISKPQFPPDL